MKESVRIIKQHVIYIPRKMVKPSKIRKIHSQINYTVNNTISFPIKCEKPNNVSFQQMTVVQPHITDGIRRKQRYIVEQVQVIKETDNSMQPMHRSINKINQDHAQRMMINRKLIKHLTYLYVQET